VLIAVLGFLINRSGNTGVFSASIDFFDCCSRRQPTCECVNFNIVEPYAHEAFWWCGNQSKKLITLTLNNVAGLNSGVVNLGFICGNRSVLRHRLQLLCFKSVEAEASNACPY